MIKIYYTGASTEGAQQNEIRKSLGGYISGTVIPNAKMNSFFRDISLLAGERNLPEVICVALKNESNSDIENVTVYSAMSSNPAQFDIQAAFVKPSTDECGNLSLEQLRTQDELPYYGEFHNIVEQSNAVNVGTIKKGEFLGMYIKREQLEANNSQAIDYSNVQQSQTEEEVRFYFNWD